uniref:Uncharacterized protein n=1 Tax=Oryza brachyantha TaxID=4533 RepID=J3L1R7_ORYBR
MHWPISGRHARFCDAVVCAALVTASANSSTVTSVSTHCELELLLQTSRASA